jgi:serine/threonine protein kinase
MAPQILAGKYELQEEIARGGMGVIYKALDRTLNRIVAIKCIHAHLSGDPSFSDRFLHEARAMARIQHDNIVTIFAVEEEAGTQFLVMEFFGPTNLRTLIRQSHRLPLREVVRIGEQLASALAYAHGQGIIHRDIKPANVLIDKRGKAKLTDFGIAAALDEASITSTGQVIGTPEYMSPEQARGVKVDGRSDLYSLGIMLYEMVSGKPPYTDASKTAILRKLVFEQHELSLQFPADVPSTLQGVIQDLLRRNPDDRIADAGRLASQLHSILSLLPQSVVSELNPSPMPQRDDRTICAIDVPTAMLRGDAAAAIHSSAAESTRIIDIRREAPPGEPPKHGKAEQVRPRVGVTFSYAADEGLIGRSFPLITTPFIIGRSQAASLAILSDPSLSRSHCAIDWHEGTYVVRNLGSTNGLWVDGCAVPHDKPQPLLSGSVLRLSAKTVLTFVFNDVCELPDLSGTILEGRYKLISQIRSSSKAVHYKADDLRVPRPVAIKILSPMLAEYPGYLEALHREAETAARLHHPHIAGVVDFGLTTVQMTSNTLKLHYVCMEYLEGGNLENRISDSQLQTPVQVMEWLDPVASAIDYAHRNGVVHGGLKPTSIVFDGEGKSYVTDFASATYSESSDRRMLLGSPDFLAPEVWEGLRPTYATDQYAIAVLLYLALCGALPFDDQQNPTHRERNFSRGAVPVHEEARRRANIEISKSISAVVAKGMASRPDDRYRSVGEFAMAFRQAIKEPEKLGKAQPEVFFSYRRDTGTAWAALFSRELERQGISLFVDMQRRDNVVRFPTWLEDAIRNCDIFVCLLSERTLDSTWVQHEIQTAFNLGKPMIPIIQEDFKFPAADQSLAPHIEALLSYQGVLLLDRKGVYFDAAIADVAKMVRDYVLKKLK